MAHDVVIIGGGIAGASLAYFLARRGVRDVVIVERESMPGTHATGRSASVWCEIEPDRVLRQLKVQGGAFLKDPPPGFSDAPVLEPTGILELYTGDEPFRAGDLARACQDEGSRVRGLRPRQARDLVPVLDPEMFAAGLLAPDSGKIDVHGLLSAYLRHAKAAGATLRCNTEVTGMVIDNDRCTGVRTDRGDIAARVVVNAAGAWAGTVAEMAGATPIPITPRRRCAAIFDVDVDVDPSWPLTACTSHSVYFAPDSGGILVSPMDAFPLTPRDARPDAETIAGGVERLLRLAPSLEPRTLRRSWAGLRTFAPDERPVVGMDPRRPGLFWLAGQGGCGIETSPALGAIAAGLITEGATDRFDTGVLSPARFALPSRS